MECNVPILVRGGGIENSDQIPNPIEINPITNPLQVLENRLKSQNPKPHCGGSEARHADIGTNIDNKPIASLSACFQFAENLLDGNGDIWFAKEFPFEHSDNVLVRLIG